MEDNNTPSEGGFQIFDNAADLQASMQTTEAPEQPQEQVVQETPPAPQEPTQEQPPVEQPPQESQYVDPEAAPSEPNQETPVEPTPEPYTQQQEQQPWEQQPAHVQDQQLEYAVLNFLSERLGRDIDSFDDLNSAYDVPKLDERVEAISKFVQETGRSPQDWFAYQSLNPSEMDDKMAVRVSLATDYKDLSSSELDLLISNKYKLNPDIHSEDEIEFSKVQLKLDASEARKRIGELRESYKAPEQQEQMSQEPEPIVDEAWINHMYQEVDTLTGLEFDLGNEKSFTFGLQDSYKSHLKEKNARLDEYFDPYIRNDGSWDIDMLSSHRALVDNIDQIAKSIYRQGLSDGQRGLVNKAANVSTSTPQENNLNNTSDPIIDQIKQYFDSGTTTFKI